MAQDTGKTPLVVGIDLGTTNSALAYTDEVGEIQVVPNEEGRKTTPSVVQLHADGTVTVGDEAKQAVAFDRENTAHFFKRDMGTPTVYEYHGRPYTPVDLSVYVLEKLKRDTEADTGCPVREAVITVPAYFHNNAREETRRAGERAGLNVLQIINEPTAAALAYGLGKGDREETVLVYDLGGGTFDITLVRFAPGEIRVLGTDGNHALGGKDWDDRIAQYAADAFREKHGTDPLDDPSLFQELLVRAEEAKKALTSSQKAIVLVQCAGQSERIEITRETFEALTADLLGQTELLVQKVLEETRSDFSAVTSVLMVGGSTRMLACRRLVQELTGKAPNLGVNPDECVAIGAALQGTLLKQESAPKKTFALGPAAAQPALSLGARRVKDVMSHSMGMIAESPARDRYLNSILIPRNLEIPTRQVKPFKVAVPPGKTGTISVYVTQGESEDPTPGACTYVGKYVISDIPAPRTGGGILGLGGSRNNSAEAVVDIAYAYDSDGVVQVSASAREGGQVLKVERHPLPEDMSWVTRSPLEVTAVEHVTVYAAVDLSGSMSGSPLSDAQDAIIGFIEQMDLAHTSVGLIRFADKVSVDVQASQNARDLIQAVRRWKIGGVGIGNATHPFDNALRLLKDIEGRRILVVLTDGVWSNQGGAENAAKKCHQAEIEVIALGFGGADRKFLNRIASADQAALFQSSRELRGAFEQIAQVVVESRAGLSLRH